MQSANRVETFKDSKRSAKRDHKEHKNFRKMRRNPSKKQWQGI